MFFKNWVDFDIFSKLTFYALVWNNPRNVVHVLDNLSVILFCLNHEKNIFKVLTMEH